MKRYLLYFSALLLVSAVAACVKSVPYVPAATPTTGTYKGTFKHLYRANNTLPYDTIAKANVTMLLDATAGTYTVTADTTTILAGSYGAYAFVSGYMVFTDKTYPKTGVPSKIHLSGYYAYGVSGSNFNLLGAVADTAGYLYQLVKQ